MKNPFITIILPCYNVESTIVDCLQSIVGQTYDNWELLAIDDGSTDRTLSLLQSFNDSRIRIVSDGEQLGLSNRLNQAAHKARGEFYARMDADDIMFSHRLEKQVQFLQQHRGVDLVGTGLISMGEDLTLHGYRLAAPRVSDPYRILKGEVLYHPTVMGRTSWFLQHPYDEEYSHSEDFALWAKSAAILTVANMQEPLVFYREKGPFTYEKYLRRHHDTCLALRSYGPEAVGKLRTQLLLLRRRGKGLIYALFHYLGIWKYVLILPNKPLEKESARRYAKILTDITGRRIQ